MSPLYDNAFAYDNVMGHAAALVEQLTSGIEGVHLDIGCGYGHIAEALLERLGRYYVGVDADQEGLHNIRDRGFEAHQFILGAEQSTYDFLKGVIGDRKVASITVLDTLEHLVDPAATLRALRSIANLHQSVLVVSVPNVSHRDVAVKMLFGRFDYTPTGLLDQTHITHFTDRTLSHMLRGAGWHEVAAKDVHIVRSDQHFPADHIALSEGSLLQSYLRAIREGADSHAFTNQLVRGCLPGPRHSNITHVISKREVKRPFLSIVMRTQGKRPDCLRDALLCMTGQSDSDFEIVLVGHKLDLEHQLLVERIVADTPQWIREKVRFIRVDHGNRTRPLNVGYAAAEGHYIVTLDDDDLVFAHYVETFHKMALTSPGAVLRVNSVLQRTEEVTTKHGAKSGRPVGKLEKEYPETFDFVEHLYTNYSPCMSVAFPRSVFHDLKIVFDEELTTAEDWDMTMRAGIVCGVVSSPEITALYRWWVNRANSQSTVAQWQWHLNRQRILQKHDRMPLLLPPGSASKIRELLEIRDRWANSSPPEGPSVPQVTASATDLSHSHEPDLSCLREELEALLSSNSWRVAKPVRQLKGDQSITLSDIPRMSQRELQDAIDSVRNSTSWRITAPLRWSSTILGSRR